MKKVRIIALAIAIVLVSAFAISCSQKEEVEVVVNVKVIGEDSEELIDTVVVLKDTEPNVLMAIVQACQDEEIAVENDGLDVTSIAGLETVDIEDRSYFWDCTIDDKAISGKAANNILTPDSEHTVVYTYSSIKIKPVTAPQE